MPLIQFGTTSYRSRSLPLSAQRIVNLFAEAEPLDTKTPIALFGAPGLSIWALMASSPIRAMRVMSGRLYVVAGGALYSIGSSAIDTISHGNIGPSTGPVMMSDNGAQLFVLNNQEGWILSTAVSASQGPLGSTQGPILIGSTTLMVDAHAAGDTAFVVKYSQTIFRWEVGDAITIVLGNGNLFSTTLASLVVTSTIFFTDALTKAVTQYALINDTTEGITRRTTSNSLIGDLSVNVEDVEGMIIGDTIEITYDDGTELITTITNLVRGPLATVSSGLPASTSAGSSVANTVTRIYKIFDVNFYPADTVVYFDNYFVLNRSGTNEFFLSALGDGTTYPGLSFAAAQVMPDNVVGLITSHEMLLVFGERSIETWYNAGATTFPFQRYDGATIERGCSAPLTIIREDNSIFFLGDDKIFYRMENNVTPARLSTHALETAWSKYSTVSDAFCFTYTTEGHKFIVLTFPTEPATWVYDTATKLWHERDSVVPSSGITQLGRWRGNCAANAFGKILIGDFLTGTIMRLDWDIYTELGTPIVGQVTSPPYREDRKRIFVSRFELEMEVGVGLVPVVIPWITVDPAIPSLASVGNFVIDISTNLVPHFSTLVAQDVPGGSQLVLVDAITNIGIGDTVQVWLDDGTVFETIIIGVSSSTNPQIFLDYSKDGGFTYSLPQQSRTLGKVGERSTRLRWLALGQAREWYFRITITDPVKRVILNAYADMYVGM